MKTIVTRPAPSHVRIESAPNAVRRLRQIDGPETPAARKLADLIERTAAETICAKHPTEPACVLTGAEEGKLMVLCGKCIPEDARAEVTWVD